MTNYSQGSSSFASRGKFAVIVRLGSPSYASSSLQLIKLKQVIELTLNYFR